VSLDELLKEASRIIAENPNEAAARELWKQKATHRRGASRIISDGSKISRRLTQ